MLPSDSPGLRSMSSGVTTSRWRIRSPNPGKNDSSVRWTVSPRPCRSVSQSLPLRWYGAYWTKHDITCLPGGAMSGSIVYWIAQSRYGRVEYQPYLPSSKARSRYSIDGPMFVNPRKWSVATGERRVHRQPVEGEVDLGRRALEPEPPDRVDEVRRQLARIDELEERPPRVECRDDDRRIELRAVLERDAADPAVICPHGHDRRLEPDLRPERLRRPRQHLGEPAVAALVERPRAELAVVLAEQVVQQHEAAPLRVRPDLRADDRRRGEIALEDVALEVVVEEVGRRARQQAHGVVEHVLGQRLEPRAEPGEASSSSGSSVNRFGGGASSSGLSACRTLLCRG